MTVQVLHGDCLEVLRGLEDNSIDAIVTDPPYGLSNTKPAQVADVLKAWVTGDTATVPAGKGFMGKDWDGFVPPPAVWEECMRVLKPGGHMAVFAGARTQDLMGLSIRLAGFEIRDTLGWVYGCLSEDTEVLVNGEWVQYHKAKVGDLALCYNKEYDTYEWQPIEDTHKYEYSDTAYRICSNNTDQIVSRNHRVLVERGGAYEFEYAENLARERQIRVPVLEGLRTLLDDLSMREPLPSGEEQVLQCELRSVRPSTGCGETDGGTRNDRDCVCGVRDEGVQTECLAEADENTNVFERMQREVARGGMEDARTQGARSMVGGNESAVRGEPARGEQPGMEGRGYLKEGARELQGRPVCSVPAGVSEHVAEGRVRNGAPSSGGDGYGSPFTANRSGASCESRTGGQSAGEPVSVRVEPGPQAVRGARYTVADLASIEPVHYEGVVWCLTVPTGAFVVRRNGKVFVTGNSGFPKSMDISKAIDKAAGAEREVVGPKQYPDGNTRIEAWPGGENGHEGWQRPGAPNGEARGARNITAPATSEAKQWDGWGTALKPAIEPIILARKPLVGTVAGNVLAYGVGGLNIDASRVSTDDDTSRPPGKIGGNTTWDLSSRSEPSKSHAAGRFPANVLLDEHAAAEMDKQSGVSKTPARITASSGGIVMFHGCSSLEELEHLAKMGAKTPDGRSAEKTLARYRESGGLKEINCYGDEGGASRFFPVFKYQAKAPKKERPVVEREDGSKIQHPTVKPLTLLEWLVTLITPPNGTVLDPFAGSGTTLEAARNKGFSAIGIEREPDYIQLINKRLEVTPSTLNN